MSVYWRDQIHTLRQRIAALEDIATREEVYDAQSKIIEEQSARIAELETKVMELEDLTDGLQKYGNDKFRENERLREAIQKHKDADAGLIIDCVDQELWEALGDA